MTIISIFLMQLWCCCLEILNWIQVRIFEFLSQNRDL